jgi:DNA-binding HxlR family transcriptional regulator
MRKSYRQEQLQKIMQVTKTIGDTSTILILYELITFGEKSFNELKRMTGINAVTLTKKLTYLKQEGLVDSRNIGIENHYFVTKKSDQYRAIITEIEKLVR